MEMCYNGTLVMPKNFAVVNDEEMTYVEGGWYYSGTQYYSSGQTAYNYLSSTALKFYGLSCVLGVSFAVLATCIGTYAGPVGTCIGAAVGAVGGIVAGSVVWGFGSACDNGALQAKQIRGGCYVTARLQNFTLSISVSTTYNGDGGGHGGGGRHR